MVLTTQTQPTTQTHLQNAGIFTSKGGRLTPIATVGKAGLILFGSSPAIHDAGRVAFVGISILGNGASIRERAER